MSKLSDRTATKYVGAMAANYETKRKRQTRWHKENSFVTAMLIEQAAKIKRVLDVPVGTGRFLDLYEKLKFSVVGIDSSSAMLDLARAKHLPGKLIEGNAMALKFKNKEFDAAICVRFLDLIEEEAMRKVVQELCRVSRHTIICTIRFGEWYVLKSNTATHDQARFKQHVMRCGWHIAEQYPIFKQGWHVLRLEPRQR